MLLAVGEVLHGHLVEDTYAAEAACEPLPIPDRNVDIVRRSFEALARGDFEAAFADHAPDTQWKTAADEPDACVYRGIEGL